jgi:hypothetical protein
MGFFFLLMMMMKSIESRRITKLLEDEVEQDEVFWNQDALKDVGAVFPSLTTYQGSLLPSALSVPDDVKFCSFHRRKKTMTTTRRSRIPATNSTAISAKM